MAQVKVVFPQPVQPPPEITLNLSVAEAMVIIKLCGNISGHGEFRQIASQIYDTLIASNIKFSERYWAWKPNLKSFVIDDEVVVPKSL